MERLASVRLAGELDLSNVSSLRAKLAAIDGPAVVDLSDVTYLDSAALNELASLRRRVGSVALVVDSPNIRRTLEIVGFHGVFRIVSNRAEL
ncbi:MAG TPA: STAS domain-containing protein [Candidatus Elarobacter sp.]|jgi:anti-anti-sigma factor|nr:STAS domain-containing protein [Candidatus Elarobacter sp.]